ncbi:radical SAM protein [Candidatus Gracilibacteria bacterium]|nr:radical SAM protein [Candidatus Gracilibacteria bacterium]
MKKYFIQTFGCQMNQADSEKVQMVLLQCGFMRASSIEDAHIVVFNTCSVRQKGEDRVFGMIQEIKKHDKDKKEKTLVGITGCMVRKTGIAKRYLESDVRKKIQKIEFLETQNEVYNSDDKLFPRSIYLDFTFRIEETKYIPHILSHILGKKIGQEDKFDDYLKQIQQRENPFSASVIIQTGCDNYCTFCIVPYTRGSEVSRENSEIVSECRESVKSGAKEVTLLGQNVNSYGKQKNIKLWNAEKSKWNNTERKMKIGIDLDDTLFVVLGEELLMRYNQKFRDLVRMEDITTFDCGGIENLMNEYHIFETENAQNLELHTGGQEVIQSLKDDGYKLYVITSREVQAKNDTLILLEKYFGNDFFEEVIFIKERGHDNKYEAANEYELDIVIDDGPHHIDAYRENFKGKICVFHSPWNRECKEDNKKIYRIHDWYEFQNLLPKLSFTSPFRVLLEDVGNIGGLDRIRFTSSNPHDMTRDILDAHFEVPSMCNYLHFALQSGSNEMLKKMNRRHSYEDFRNMVYYLRSRDPLFSISTDIIVGFSGETDEMFEATIKAFEECQFDFSYTARYSVRPQTLAAQMFPDDVPDNIKAERWHILNSLLLKNVQTRNELMLGRIEDILISGERDEQFFGRTRNFKEVFFEKSEGVKIGDIIPVKITDMERYVLRGYIA